MASMSVKHGSHNAMTIFKSLSVAPERHSITYTICIFDLSSRLTMTQLPRLRCLSSGQNVRMLNKADCCMWK